jgi:hypothetical protein
MKTRTFTPIPEDDRVANLGREKDDVAAEVVDAKARKHDQQNRSHQKEIDGGDGPGERPVHAVADCEVALSNCDRSLETQKMEIPFTPAHLETIAVNTD